MKQICTRIALESVAPDEICKVIKSVPYVKKQNRMGDMAQWQCWHIHLRTCRKNEESDKLFTLVRHNYQPPLMEQFTDLVVVS